MLRSVVTLATCAVLGWSAAAAEPAEADTGPSLESVGAPAAPSPDGAGPAADSGAPQDQAAPVDDSRVESSPPANTKSPDGWTLTVSAHDETEMPVPSLTDEAATREYIVGGVFNGSVHAPDGTHPPEGTFEVGYQIACGEDLSTGPGIMMSGNIGLLPGAGVSVSIKPGVVNIIPVTKKEFKGADPWVMISGFSLKIDGSNTPRPTSCENTMLVRTAAIAAMSVVVLFGTATHAWAEPDIPLMRTGCGNRRTRETRTAASTIRSCFDV